MKVLLTLANSKDVKAGVEVLNSQLKKVFPDLAIIDFKSLSKKYKIKEPGFSLTKEPKMAQKLDKWFMQNYDKYKPDIVFSNGMYGWDLDRKIIKAKTITIQHGGFAAFANKAMKKTSLNYWRIRYIYSNYEKRNCQKSDMIVSNSEFTRYNIKKYYKVDSTVINNAIDTDLMKPVGKLKARKLLGIPEEARVAIFVGRPDYSKGFDIIKKLAKLSKDIVFISITNPKTSLGEKNIIEFSDVNQNRLGLFYSASDFCLFPSRFEGFGYVPLESLACNTPVIGNPVGIFRDIKINGAYQVNSIREYLEAIKTINTENKINSRAFIKKHFPFEKFKKEYRALAKELLN